MWSYKKKKKEKKSVLGLFKKKNCFQVTKNTKHVA